MNYSVVVLAAGSGTRMNLGYNKVLYRFKDGELLLSKTLRVFLEDEDCKQVILVTTPQEIDSIQAQIHHDKIVYAYGGSMRQDSVYEGLKLVSEEYVMIHDGARCFVDKVMIEDLKEALVDEDACLLMVPVIDTIKVVEDGYVVNTLNRDVLYAAQTPQCFKTDLIRKCHQMNREKQESVSDDASLVERFSDVKVKVVKGSYANKKVTTIEDL